MFIDTSIIVALLAREADAPRFADCIARSETRLTSGLVILEAAMRLSSLLKVDPREAELRIEALLDEATITVMPIDAETAKTAVAAFAVYGKGRGHAARLNLADCLSYACAKAMRVPLLFKGDDFAKTDIARADQ